MKQLLSLIFLVSNILCVSQNNKIDLLLEHYVDYYEMAPETTYIHINKSNYLHGENLWFKAYIYDTKTQKPYMGTTNVYATIYSENGDFKEQKMYYAKQGMTYGGFNLKENYPSGIYFIKIATNWMKNFDEKHQIIQQFEILGNDSASMPVTLSEPSYDFQLLPEGGKLLQNVINTIGFKVIDHNGDGVEIVSGSVTDSKKNIINTFKSNEFGMGKFDLFLAERESYVVSLVLKDGTTLDRPIENVQNIGITVSVNNLNTDKLFINLKTNSLTLPALINNTYYLALHRDGMIRKMEVDFKAQQLDYIIPISKSELFPGINILTLFDHNNQPILERMVYNKSNVPIDKLQFLGVSKIKDSVQIRFRTERMDTLQKSISVSVLPSLTKAYDFDSNIQSKFLLEPYLKGHIENTSYYFQDSDRTTDYNLDLLLLTQGWSSYSWNALFYSEHKAVFDFEKGMQIKGKLNSGSSNEDREIILFSSDNELMVSSEVSDTNIFMFDNLFIKDSTSISLSVRDKKSRLAYSGLYYNTYPKPQIDRISTKHLIKKKYVNTYVSPTTSFIFDDTILLDEISIEAKEKKPINTIVQGSFNARNIDLENASFKNARVIDIIRQNGFNVDENFSGVRVSSRRRFSFHGPSNPRIYLDNVEITAFTDELLFIYADQVEELFISTTPSVNSIGGNIHIFRKKSFTTGATKSDFNTSTVNFGFTLPEAYYSPNYNKSQSEQFSNYGAIHWIPEIQTNESNEFVFKIPYYGDSINLFINGMTSDGGLIAKTETIDLKQFNN